MTNSKPKHRKVRVDYRAFAINAMQGDQVQIKTESGDKTLLEVRWQPLVHLGAYVGGIGKLSSF